jgi:hypothetical protein
MKYLFGILLMMSTYTFAQTPEIYGLWASQEGEFVEINYNNTFSRFKIISGSKKKKILSKGIVEIIDKELHIVRKDTIDGYKLCYYLGSETMAVCKPRSNKAWLFQKIK